MFYCASSWLQVILAPQLKVSKSPRAGMLEGQSVYLLKLVPRILIQTCCPSISYTLLRVSALQKRQKNGWLQFLTVTNLHCYRWAISALELPIQLAKTFQGLHHCLKPYLPSSTLLSHASGCRTVWQLSCLHHNGLRALPTPPIYLSQANLLHF